MSKTILCPVILCGGTGARLWPMTQYDLPKPFMTVDKGPSLLHQAYGRAGLLPNIGEIVTVTNRDFYFRSRDEYQKCAFDYQSTFILEPFARNTAPAIATAMTHIRTKFGDDALILVLPADHIIDDHDAFIQVVEQAAIMATGGKIVIFGINPDRAETGYGYIEADGGIVKAFIEKPDVETVKAYLASGNYLWNSGIFCFRVDTMIKEMTQYAPVIMSMAKQAYNNAARYQDMNYIEIKADDFVSIPDISVDYAVIEKLDHAVVIPCDMGWRDVGSWDSFRQQDNNKKDENGNHVIGDAILQNAFDCYVESHGKITGIVGVQNLIIINTPEAVLVAHADRSQDVKDIAAKITRTSFSGR